MKTMAHAFRAAGFPLPKCAFKNTYATKEVAEQKANHFTHLRQWILHVYYCERCHGWHITKQPQRKEIRRNARPNA